MASPLPPILAAMAVLLGSCAAPPVTVPPPGERVTIPAPARQALHSLEHERDYFLATGDPEKVFAVFYCHITREILRRAAAGELPQPDVILEMLAGFHTAYERSRSAASREAHWRPYYRRAEELRAQGWRWSDVVHPLDGVHPRGLLTLGVVAHVDYDLPRCIAQVLARHPALRPDAVAAAYRSLDSLLAPCAAAGFADLARRVPHSPGPRALAAQTRVARRMVLHKRHRAWQAALHAAGQTSSRMRP
jgi:Family of unknown function (DUF5995)